MKILTLLFLFTSQISSVFADEQSCSAGWIVVRRDRCVRLQKNRREQGELYEDYGGHWYGEVTGIADGSCRIKIIEDWSTKYISIDHGPKELPKDTDLSLICLSADEISAKEHTLERLHKIIENSKIASTAVWNYRPNEPYIAAVQILVILAALELSQNFPFNTLTTNDQNELLQMMKDLDRYAALTLISNFQGENTPDPNDRYRYTSNRYRPFVWNPSDVRARIAKFINQNDEKSYIQGAFQEYFHSESPEKLIRAREVYPEAFAVFQKQHDGTKAAFQKVENAFRSESVQFIEGWESLFPQTSTDFIKGFNKSSELMKKIKASYQNKNKPMMIFLANRFPDSVALFWKDQNIQWYQMDSALIDISLFSSLNELMVTADQLPQLELSLRAQVKKDKSEINRYFIYYMAMVYFKSQTQNIRTLESYVVSLLALRVQLNSEGIELPQFINTLNSEKVLSDKQVQGILKEYGQLKDKEGQQVALLNKLIDIQLKVTNKKISTLESKMSEMMTLGKEYAHPEMAMLLDGYLALYQMEPDRVIESLNKAISGMSLSAEPGALKAAINDLIESTAEHLEELDKVTLAIEDYQNDISNHNDSLLDVIGDVLLEPKNAANPKLIEILSAAAIEINDQVSAGFALQISLNEMIEETFASYKATLAVVRSMDLK